MSNSVTGKAFENKFKNDWIKSFPNGTIDRLPDSMSGFKAISNVSDYICYNYPNIYYIECKARKGASISFTDITQYDKMNQKASIKGVRVGIVLYLYEKYRVFYIPISTITQLKEEGKKSVGVKAFEEGYNIIEIPSKKLRTFMDSDYTILATLEEGN